VCDPSPCYEKLVKEFMLNISVDCKDKTSKEFRKVYVRGRCVDFPLLRLTGT